MVRTLAFLGLGRKIGQSSWDAHDAGRWLRLPDNDKVIGTPRPMLVSAGPPLGHWERPEIPRAAPCGSGRPHHRQRVQEIGS